MYVFLLVVSSVRTTSMSRNGVSEKKKLGTAQGKHIILLQAHCHNQLVEKAPGLRQSHSKSPSQPCTGRPTTLSVLIVPIAAGLRSYASVVQFAVCRDRLVPSNLIPEPRSTSSYAYIVWARDMRHQGNAALINIPRSPYQARRHGSRRSGSNSLHDSGQCRVRSWQVAKAEADPEAVVLLEHPSTRFV